MNLYLTRHGEALPKHIDPSRGLSEDGKEIIEKLAEMLLKNQVHLSYIFHSGKKRALETAGIIRKVVAPDANLIQRNDISPNDPVDTLLNDIITWTEDTMIVGHLPHIGEVYYSLTHKQNLIFNTGTTIHLKRDGKDIWTAVDLIDPNMDIS